MHRMANAMADTPEMPPVTKDDRRTYDSGSLYQRTSDWRWIGAVDAGYTATGARKRVTVTGKGCVGGCKKKCPHIGAMRRKVDRKYQEVRRGEHVPSASARMTVKSWAAEYLELRKQPPKALSPNGWNAAASPIRKWIIPTIGHRRLAELTPADRRKVAQAQYDAGLKTSTADATDRALMTMLRRAQAEGHKIPDAVLATEGPGPGVSDRRDVPLEHALACLAVTSQMPHGIRWALTLLYGTRQGEMLGLVERDPIDGSPCIDFETKTIHLAWQLQDLQRVDRKRPELGYRIPRDYEAVQLRGMYHLTRPKSKKGYRVLPMIPPVEDALRAWLEVRPENPWGLVFPTAKGRPCNDKVDREEWWAIQYTASVAAVEAGEYAAPREPLVFHPGGRYWHIHECRNLAATELDRAGASDNVITSLLGHASIVTSRGYMTAHLDSKRQVIEQVAERLGLSGPANS